MLILIIKWKIGEVNSLRNVKFGKLDKSSKFHMRAKTSLVLLLDIFLISQRQAPLCVLLAPCRQAGPPTRHRGEETISNLNKTQKTPPTWWNTPKQVTHRRIISNSLKIVSRRFFINPLHRWSYYGGTATGIIIRAICCTTLYFNEILSMSLTILLHHC